MMPRRDQVNSGVWRHRTHRAVTITAIEGHHTHAISLASTETPRLVRNASALSGETLIGVKGKK